jgi:site-specific DNA recombinase
MLGTRAHGKTRVYRYYSCYRRTRYDSAACGAQRIDADAIEHAVIGALASFYRQQHAPIADSIAATQASHAAAEDGRRGELAATEHQLAKCRVFVQ